jgi:hypothetical protein
MVNFHRYVSLVEGMRQEESVPCLYSEESGGAEIVSIRNANHPAMAV